MSNGAVATLRTPADIARFEAEMTLDQRLPERSVLDVFIAGAAREPDRTALTMLMTGAPDEQPRRVSYRELLGLVRRAANLFATLAGPRPGVAYMLPSLVETHATLWGAETAGYAVPINFLLQPEHIAGLLKASGARILVALGPHPVLDIWQKALALREQVPGLHAACAWPPPGTPLEDGVIDFHAALMAQPDDRLTFGEPGRDGDVAAYFHTGGTTGTPKLVAHTHRGQLVAALGGAVLGDMRPSDTLTATLPLFHVGGTIFCASQCVHGRRRACSIMSPGGLRNPAMVQGFWRLVGAARRHAGRGGAHLGGRGARGAARRCRPQRGARRLLRRGVAAARGRRALPAGHRPRAVRGLWHDRGLGPDRHRPAGRPGRCRLGRLAAALHAGRGAPARGRRPPGRSPARRTRSASSPCAARMCRPATATPSTTPACSTTARSTPATSATPTNRAASTSPAAPRT